MSLSGKAEVQEKSQEDDDKNRGLFAPQGLGGLSSASRLVKEWRPGRQDSEPRPVMCIYFVTHLWPMGLHPNVLGYQSHLMQRCHPVCGQ